MGKTEAECDCTVLHTEVVTRVQGEMPSEQEVNAISELFRLFSDSTRVRILWALDREELCVCDIAALLGMTKSAVSHQLKVLREQQLIRSRRAGKVVFYALKDEHVREIFEMAVEHLAEG